MTILRRWASCTRSRSSISWRRICGRSRSITSCDSGRPVEMANSRARLAMSASLITSPLTTAAMRLASGQWRSPARGPAASGWRLRLCRRSAASACRHQRNSAQQRRSRASQRRAATAAHGDRKGRGDAVGMLRHSRMSHRAVAELADRLEGQKEQHRGRSVSPLMLSIAAEQPQIKDEALVLVDRVGRRPATIWLVARSRRAYAVEPVLAPCR